MTNVLFQLFLKMGADWVLWLLMALSVLSLGIILNRWFALRSLDSAGVGFWKSHVDKWMSSGGASEWQSKSENFVKSFPCVETRMLQALSVAPASSLQSPELLADSVLSIEKLRLEKYLSVLGTLGSNAPFIGLFGTVLGIIRAFNDLGGGMESAGVQAVSAGLAEALVATAVGLFVAIPSVVFYNYYNRKIKNILGRARSLSSFILSTKR